MGCYRMVHNFGTFEDSETLVLALFRALPTGEMGFLSEHVHFHTRISSVIFTYNFLQQLDLSSHRTGQAFWFFLKVWTFYKKTLNSS